MKMKFFCLECDLPTIIETEISEKNIYELTCNQGHKKNYIVQIQKFELLYELAAYALLDGYTREAVSGFAVAVERLHEYCIQILLIKNSVSKENRDKTFKMVSRMSERQLGAFYYLYLNEFKEPPQPIPDTRTKFRNNVTHNGEIPTYEKTIEYAEYIFNYIIRLLKKIRSIENIDHYELEYYGDYQMPTVFMEETQKGNPPTGMCVISMIGTNRGNRDFSDKNFKIQFEQLKERERWLYN
ncbi:hypothetical protein MOE28_16710 [Bacillus atrophaeus]|uniref:hypothetical protein n=1 Tax=Bacillus atrophaeus TaxID=1452 RepID=UPI00227E371E|nr:hypothetical protein [Bacillus atrophaeus]MCY8951437.1 hypothetical protein [Bacillus atrophaeus]